MAKRTAAAKKSSARKTAQAKAVQKPAAIACQCESPSNALVNGLVIGTSFGVLLSLITGNYALWLPVCIALGLVFGNFFKC